MVPAGKEIAEHKAKGEIVVQCLEGKVAFDAFGFAFADDPVAEALRRNWEIGRGWPTRGSKQAASRILR